VALGCFAWGLITAAGLSALLEASALAYGVLRWTGAIYLFYLGVRLLAAPRRHFELAERSDPDRRGAASGSFARGFLTNILNPKVGMFYVSFLPQFIPAHASVAGMTILLTTIHLVLGIAWFAVLILATRPVARLLRRPAVVAWLDRVTGAVFIAFGVRLALGQHR
jgi:threonine/homoserine/homoserine lactone efflux protein